MQCVTPYRKKDPRKGMIDFPCGNCFACRVNKVRDWTTRLLIEAQGSVYTYFVTLTYSDEHLPMVQSSDFDVYASLNKVHMQLFHKRLRKKGFIFRYYVIGEYGTHTKRPHYHGIYFTQKSLNVLDFQEIWGLGNCRFDAVNAAAIGYVCRYHLLPEEELPKCMEKPFSIMSRRPGLGYGYLFDHEVRKWHTADYDNRQYAVIDGKKRFLPSYLKKKMYTSLGLQINAAKLREAQDNEDRRLMDQGIYGKKLNARQAFIRSKELERRLNKKSKL